MTLNKSGSYTCTHLLITACLNEDAAAMLIIPALD